MDTQALPVSMIVLFVAAYAAAEYYARRAPARDAARAAARRGDTMHRHRVTRTTEPSGGQLMSFPWGSGPCR